MFFLVKDPDSLYEIDFSERYLDLFVTSFGGFILLKYAEMTFQLTLKLTKKLTR